MPNATKIMKTMRKKKIPGEILAQFNAPEMKGNQDSMVKNVMAAVAVIDKMDMLLTEEQRLSIMEEQRCSKTDKFTAPHRAFGLEHTDIPLAEKIKLYNETDMSYVAKCRLNPDGTLAVSWGTGEEGEYDCVCSGIKRLRKDPAQPTDVSLTYCGCCAGYIRYTRQYALGIKLRLKKIVSSPINSKGKNRCEFLFEVVD